MNVVFRKKLKEKKFFSAPPHLLLLLLSVESFDRFCPVRFIGGHSPSGTLLDQLPTRSQHNSCTFLARAFS
jgi:hypothetical protein